VTVNSRNELIRLELSSPGSSGSCIRRNVAICDKIKKQCKKLEAGCKELEAECKDLDAKYENTTSKDELILILQRIEKASLILCNA
jgi:hypothetical protein